jgi:hypothetical protein
VSASLALPDYREIGCTHWLRVRRDKYDPIGRVLADGHYSRRKPGSPQFMPPGETIVLVSRDGLSVWGWWRPHPRSGIRAMNGLDGFTCSIFRRTGGALASEMVLDAELAMLTLAALGELAGACGPSGMLTYVDAKKVASSNPGYCFKQAGWVRVGKAKKRGKPLLWKPVHLAGIPACGWPRPALTGATEETKSDV